MSKSDLRERPIFHYKQDRIKGHLLICFCSLLVMKEAEKLLRPIGISLIKAIEVLGKVGQGNMVLGNVTMPIESELSTDAEAIMKEILGH